MVASRRGRDEVVKFLLQDPRVDPSGKTANDWYTINILKQVAEAGHVEVIRLLLQDGRANPASESNAGLFQ